MPKYFHFHIDSEEVVHHFDQPLETIQCQYIKENKEQCKNRVCIGQPYCWIHERIGKHLQIATSKIVNAGLGVFAYNGTDDDEILFKEGDPICPYYGEIINEQELISRYGDKTAPYGIQIKAHQIYEDGALKRGIGTLINHLPVKKNCRFSIAKNNTVNIVATKNIRNKQELYISYGRSYKINETNVSTSTNQRKKAV
jgi:hypothetical protein